jgi:hypothetical protein
MPSSVARIGIVWRKENDGATLEDYLRCLPRPRWREILPGACAVTVTRKRAGGVGPGPIRPAVCAAGALPPRRTRRAAHPAAAGGGRALIRRAAGAAGARTWRGRWACRRRRPRAPRGCSWRGAWWASCWWRSSRYRTRASCTGASGPAPAGERRVSGAGGVEEMRGGGRSLVASVAMEATLQGGGGGGEERESQERDRETERRW